MPATSSLWASLVVLRSTEVHRRCQYVEIPLYRPKDRPVPSDEDLRRMECAMSAHREALAADFGPLPVLPGAKASLSLVRVLGENPRTALSCRHADGMLERK